MTAALHAEFLHPGAVWRGKPFWAWNGRLEREELLRQIRVMKQMGFGGFFMHSRTGLVTEYLGDEWFDHINACADEAERLGMEAWLYDEDRWPSGTAGGLVTEHPEFRARSVWCDVQPLDIWPELAWNGDLVAVFRAEIDGLSFRNATRLRKGQRLPQSSNESTRLLVFRVVEMPASSFYNGFTYVDTMNAAATRRFLELTHERYAAKCGDRLGRSIKGIFTDEPHRGQLMDGFSMDKEPTGPWRAPWTAELPAQFRIWFGYDLIDRLPELFLQRDGQPVSQVKWHFVECLQRLFLQNFAEPCQAWCRKHHLILTGHVLHEDSLAAQTAMNGSLMRYYEHLDWPGIDVLSGNNTCFWIAKQLQSAARQLGRTWLLSELYGCSGWHVDFRGHKWIGAWQALFGINVRCHHLSWYSMEGEAKRDYPASILHQSAWWDSYGTVEDFFARFGLLMAQGRARCDVLVLNPVESVWCQVHAGWSRFLVAQTPALQALEKAYADLFHALSGTQTDFDYGDEEMLSRLASVESTPTGPLLHVGKAAYRVVVVGRMVTMRASTLELLKRFRAAGGAVLFADEAPGHIDAVPSPRAALFAATCQRVLPTGAAISAALAAVLPARPVTLRDAQGKPVEHLFSHVRETEDGLVVALLNASRERPVAGVTISLHAPGLRSVEEWSALDGSRKAVTARWEGDYAQITTDFPAGGEHFYVLGRTTTRRRRPTATLPHFRELPAKGPFRYRLGEANACVLDMASYRIGDGAWHRPVEILKADQAVRRTLGLAERGGEMLQPWFALRQQTTLPAAAQVAFRFAFAITIMPSSPVELAIERPEAWRILLNGTPLDPLTATGWWLDVACKRIPLPPALLRRGENCIEIETGFSYATNPEALFLLGAFGVQLEGADRQLVDLPARLAATDLARQGLPFFTGSVVYDLAIPPACRPGDHVVLRLPAFGAVCAKVHADGMQTAVVPWPPYEADVTAAVQAGAQAVQLELLLSRRNAFGPLHQWPPAWDVIGPFSFLTEGRHWRKEYQLEPTGLLGPPRFLHAIA